MLLWLLACGTAVTEEPVLEVPFALQSRSFEFCHRPGAGSEAMAEWCEHLDEIPKERCPGLHETCAGAEPVPPSGCNRQSGGGDDGDKSLAKEPEKPKEPWSFEASMPDMAFVGEVLRWVMAMMVAAGVLVLLRYLWARFGRKEEEIVRPPVIEVEIDQEALDEALPEVPSAPSDDLLTMARRALDEGRAGDAVVLARGAALRRLGESGRLRLHRSRTDREYVVAMRDAGSPEDGEDADSLRIVTAMVEVFRFGMREPPVEGARDALKAAARILRIGVCLLMLGVSGWAQAQTPERFDANGDAAFRELFDQRGYEVSWRLRSLDSIKDEDADALFLDVVGTDPSMEEWQAIREWVALGGVVFAVGDASPGFPELGSVHASDAPIWILAPTLHRLGYEAPWLPGMVDAYVDGSASVWVENEDGGAVLAALPLGDGVLLSLADWRFGDNASLMVPANEALLGDALYHGQGLHDWPLPTPTRVQLATRMALSSDDQADNPLESLARAELLPFVLQFLLFWVVFALWRGWPFGALKDPPEEGRTRFADHVEALGDRYRRLGASRHAARSYATLWMQRLGPKGMQLAAVSYGMSKERAAEFVEELEALVGSTGDEQTPDSAADFQGMEELWNVVEHRDRGTAS